MTVAARIDLGRVEVVTMRELTLHTAEVIDRVRAEAKPRAITRHGRLLAIMHPMVTGSPARLLQLAAAEGLIALPASESAGVPVEDLLEGRAERRAASEPPAGREDQYYGVVTSKELSQQPSAVVARVQNGEHLLVTRHGRFMVYLKPIPAGLTSHLLASATNYLRTLDEGSQDGEGRGYSVETVTAYLDS